MMKYYESILVLFILLFLGSLAQAQTITRDEFLNQLKSRHPLFEKEKMTSQILREEQKGYLGAEDWKILSSVYLSHEEPAMAFSGPEKTDAISISGGVERVFWKTGGRLSASFSSGYAQLKINPAFGFPDAIFQNQMDLSYIHPLLKNKNGFLDQLQYDLQQFNIDLSEIKTFENLEDFLAVSASKFLDWVFLSEQMKIMAERMKLSEEELKRTEKKRKANLVDQADVIRAEDAVRITRQNQMLIDARWHALQAELAVLTQNNELYNLSPKYSIYEFTNTITTNDAVDKLKENSRLLKLLNIQVNQLQYSRKGFEETSKPELSAIAQLNIKRMEDGFGQSLLLNKPDAIVGLQFSFPLGNTTAKSQIAVTDLQISKMKIQIDELTLTLSSALTYLIIQMKELVNVLELNQEQIESAKERTKEELKLYNQGRGELTFVIQSRDNEQNAKLTYAMNALSYHKLLLQYNALMDQLYK